MHLLSATFLVSLLAILSADAQEILKGEAARKVHEQLEKDPAVRKARYELQRKLQAVANPLFDLPGCNLNDRFAKKPRLKNPHDQMSKDAVRQRSAQRILYAASTTVGLLLPPTYYRLSDTKPDGTPLFPARWETVPAPTANCYQSGVDPGVDILLWQLNRAATIEVSNALIDADQRRGPWSQPKVLNVADGWSLWGHPDNQPNEQKDVGIVWKVKFVKNTSTLAPIWADGSEVLFSKQQDGVVPGVSGFNTNSPASPISQPYAYPLSPMFGQYDRYKSAAPSGRCDIVAPPPDVYSVTIPDKNYEVAFCWVTHKGETALSPIQPAPQSDLQGLSVPPTFARVAARRLFVYGQPQQLGALGYHVYLREKDGKWIRQLARKPIDAAAAEEDWLFGVDNYQSVLHHAAPANAPVHAPVAQPQSWCSGLHLALWYTKRDIIVDVPVEICCPLCDPYWSNWGNQTSTYAVPAKTLTIPARTTTVPLPGGGTATAQVTGSKLTIESEKTIAYEDPLKLPYTGGFGHMKFGRAITAATSRSTFKVTATLTVPGLAAPCVAGWPALHIQNQRSVWEGLELSSPVGVCWTGVTWSDWSGGQSFGTILERCRVSVPAATIERPTRGIKVAWECVGGNGHSASELKFLDLYIDGATVPVFLEQNQTADVVADRIFVANFLANRRAPCFWLDAPVTFNFRGGVYCQSSGTVFSLGWSPKVVVEDVFIDQPFVSLVDCASHQPGDVSFLHGKVNFFSPRANVPQWLFRVNNSTNEFPFWLDGLTTQLSGASEIYAYHPHRNRAKLVAERADGLYPAVTLLQADAAQWKEATTAVWGADNRVDLNPAETGLKITIPSRTVDFTGPAEFTSNGAQAAVAGTLKAKVVVPAQDVVFNSLSSAQKTVRTKAWATPNPLLPNTDSTTPVVPAPIN